MKARLPMYGVALALLGLIAVLATLQYRWLGRISADERDRRSAALVAQARDFADDFDRELTRAYLIFQWEPAPDIENLATRVAARYERWQSTARLPRLLQDIYVVRPDREEQPLQRFNPAGRLLEPVEWPETLAELKALTRQKPPDPAPPPGAGMLAFTRTLPQALWGGVPALVVPLPIPTFHTHPEGAEFRLSAVMSYAVLVLDREYIGREVLPSLAEQHFRGTPDGADFKVAVVAREDSEILFTSAEGFAPAPGARADAERELFQVRPQEFGGMVSEIRRISTFVAAAPGGARSGQVIVQTVPAPGAPSRAEAPQTRIELREGSGMTVVLPPGATQQERAAVVAGTAAALAGRPFGGPAPWRLVVQHRAGSLEAAVDAARRRNLAISFGVLGLLGVSVGFLVVSTRRAQQLARQQMEFVAAVSHELRTPLAVIRSAGDNLAEGVVAEPSQVQKYGALVRNEGRRLTEMVEQILEFAGIGSGQRTFALGPVAVRPVLEAVLDASRTLIDEAGLRVEVEVPEALPPVLGDEPALRRVFQNLVGNAVKYGASGGRIRIAAAQAARDVRVTVADAGPGIPAAEHERIFEPFYRAPEVVAAQIQGAGLGLSLVKRIVEAHGGRVTLRSAPGQGSAFTVQLPAAAEEPLPRAAGDEALGDAHGSRA